MKPKDRIFIFNLLMVWQLIEKMPKTNMYLQIGVLFMVGVCAYQCAKTFREE